MHKIAYWVSFIRKYYLVHHKMEKLPEVALEVALNH